VPYCSFHVRATSFFCRRLTSFHLFLSATATDIDLIKRFEEATAYASVSVSSLEPHTKYPITRAKRISTKYGLSVVLTLRGPYSGVVQVFLPQLYSDVMTEADLECINIKEVTLHLVYKGVCESSKAYLLAIEQ